ncbi:MAG: 1-phosphofructokinase [Lachnospiraceae bacterium]|nr:1-phosphofructokinase [Lachnospiraceae bacterium]
MFYTVTLNPAMDYVITANGMKPGRVNRSTAEELHVGGKGINVSIVLKELGIGSKALGFTAGFTGEEIEKRVAAMGVEPDFVRLKTGCSRINVKIRSDRETELNGQGPDISPQAQEQLFAKLDSIKDGDTLILAGSVPASLSPDIYGRILLRLADRKVRVVVDATKELLWNALPYKPFLIKPNRHELEELFGIPLPTQEAVLEYAAQLRSMGAANVLVSLADEGALLLDENGRTHIGKACRGRVINSVAAGDSMVAGFLAGASEGDYEYALKLGTAAGGATAFSEGLAKREEIQRLLEQL